MKALFGGLGPWLVQRATALLALVLLLGHVIALAIARPPSAQAWQHWMQGGLQKAAVLAFFAAAALHAWVGMRDVILDYVKPLALRLPALTAVALWLLGTVIACAAVL